MDAAVALQRKKTLKFLCIVDFPLSKQGIFFVTLKHKPVTKKMSQAFFFAVSSKIGNFANQFLDTTLQCCPTVLGRFSQLDAHFPGRFLEFGRGGDNFFEKNRINPAAFRMFSISPWSVFCRLRGFFAFLTVFSLFSGFQFYTYGQSAGNHVGNEYGGLFHPPGDDYHRHYR